MSEPTVDAKVLADAWRHARQAAQHSGVEMRQVSGSDAELAQVVVREACGPQQMP